MAQACIQTLPTTNSKRKRKFTEADLPPRPPQLGSTATASEKALRAAIMQERRRVQKQLQEQKRGARDRSCRKRDADSERRVVQRLLSEARSRPLPQVTPHIFESLWRHRSSHAAACWNEVLQRPMPASATHSRKHDDDERVVRVGGQVSYAEIRCTEENVFELRDGTFDEYGCLRNGILYEFDYACSCANDELGLQHAAASTIQAAMRNAFLRSGPRRLPQPKGCPPEGCLCRRCMLAPLKLLQMNEADLQGERCQQNCCPIGLKRIEVVHTPKAPCADEATSFYTDQLRLAINSCRLDGSPVIQNDQPVIWMWKRAKWNSASSNLAIASSEEWEPDLAMSWLLGDCVQEIPTDVRHRIVSHLVKYIV